MERLLNALKADRACLTVDALMETCGLERRPLCDELRQAVAAGYVTLAQRGCYSLTPAGRRALKSGKRLAPPPAPPPPRGGGAWKDTARKRMWAACRALGKFTRADVMEVASREGEDLTAGATEYLSALAKAGYLIRLHGRVQVSAHLSAGQIRWRLVNDTGPLAPQLKRGRRVYDPNLGREVTTDDAPGA